MPSTYMLVDPNNIVNYKVSWIKKAIRESVRDVTFVELVETIFSQVPRNNVVGKLWEWQNKFLFIKEPRGRDYVKHAMEFVRDGRGDCEDFVVFNSTILKLFGFPVRIRVTDTKGMGYFTHILIQYKDTKTGQWVNFDGTYRKKGIGGEPVFYRKFKHFVV